MIAPTARKGFKHTLEDGSEVVSGPNLYPSPTYSPHKPTLTNYCSCKKRNRDSIKADLKGGELYQHKTLQKCGVELD